jgi:ribonucleoside-diphosphate reductase beta chain
MERMSTNGQHRRESYATITRGLNWDSIPMRLFQKAKKLGTWDPMAIDLSSDRRVWAEFEPLVKDVVTRNLSLFQAGEEGVTLDLLPLIMNVAKRGWIEDEIYLTSFLWEEAKHTEFFRRWLDEVAGGPLDLERYLTPSYKTLFYEELPSALGALEHDSSNAALVRAAATYNMIIEGTLAETGYYGFRKSLELETPQGELRGLLEAVSLIARDESRHIRYGVYLIDRLVAQEPELWDVLQERMRELLPLALGVVTEFYSDYEEGALDEYGLPMEEVAAYSASQFDKRMKVLERDRGKALAEIEAATLGDLEAEEAETAAV